MRRWKSERECGTQGRKKSVHFMHEWDERRAQLGLESRCGVQIKTIKTWLLDYSDMGSRVHQFTYWGSCALCGRCSTVGRTDPLELIPNILWMSKGVSKIFNPCSDGKGWNTFPENCCCVFHTSKCRHCLPVMRGSAASVPELDMRCSVKKKNDDKKS